MSRKTLTILAALIAALALAPAAHAATQTRTVPGVGTVTVSEPQLKGGFSPYAYVTITAADTATSTEFAPVVFVAATNSSQAFVLRAHGTGGAVTVSAESGGGTTECRWLSGAGGVPDPSVRTSVSADQRSVTFAIERFNYPMRFRWLAIDGRPSQLGPATQCDPYAVISGDVGVKRNVFTDPAGLEFVGPDSPWMPPPLPAPTLTATALDGGAALSWDAIAGADGYDVNADGEVLHHVASTNRYTLRGLVNGRRHIITVHAYTEAGPHSLTPGLAATVTVTPRARADADGDTISNDWRVKRRPAAAPARPQARDAGPYWMNLTLPKVRKGVRLGVYRSDVGGYRWVETTTKRRLTIANLDPSTRYRVKLVRINRAGRQSAASKPLTVTTESGYLLR